MGPFPLQLAQRYVAPHRVHYRSLSLTIAAQRSRSGNAPLDFLNAVGGRLAAASGDPRETSFLWQRISVLIQRFKLILIGETFVHPDEAPVTSSHF